MANDEYVAILRRGVAEWNAWRKQHIEAPDLSDADLSGANLSGADLLRADLRSADLHDASLRDANLRGADLSGANLRGVDLSGADLSAPRLSDPFRGVYHSTDAYLRSFADRPVALRFSTAGLFRRGANLSDADLSGANLSVADLSGADLSDANLSDASLRDARLNGADLSGANLTNTKFGWTALGNVDLSAVKGIETAEHLAPSSIGIDTIFRSHGKIPEIFLRGAGVPEPFIVRMKDLVAAMEPIQFYSCFISYNHADKSFARRLYDTLQGRKINCYLDEKQMLPGDDIYEQVARGIEGWDKVLLCCSKYSLTNWWVDHEIDTAFEKERRLMEKRGEKTQVLVPLNLDGYIFQWASGKAVQVRARLAADFTGWERDNAKFESEIEKVILALRADAAAREAPPPPRL